MKRYAIVLVIALAFAGNAWSAAAAVIELRDGHVFLGTFIKGDRNSVVFATTQGERVFQVRDLARITFGGGPPTGGPRGGPRTGSSLPGLEEDFADLLRTMMRKAKEAVEELDLKPKPQPR